MNNKNKLNDLSIYSTKVYSNIIWIIYNNRNYILQIHRDDSLPIGICKICWKCINDFHQFYKSIEIIHTNYYGYLEIKNGLNISSNIKSEKSDPNNEDNDVHLSSSFNHLNIELVEIEPIIQIKIEDENSEFDVKQNDVDKRTVNKCLKYVKKISKTDINKNDRVRKSKYSSY